MDSQQPGGDQDRMFIQRQALVDNLKQRGLIISPLVEAAFRTVPRHLFLPGVDSGTVYSDTYVATKLENGVPISSSSQPAIMAAMLEQLDLQPGQNILEIGAGTGYNAALIAHIVGESGSVVTIDIDEDITTTARERLKTVAPNVQVICADGGFGYFDLAPYDRVILTVGSQDITPAWRDQLKAGGKMVLPFKLTPFRSIFHIQNFALETDQAVVALEHKDTYLESYDIQGAGFIPLRGAFSGQHQKILQPRTNPAFNFTFKNEIDADELYGLLQGNYRDQQSGIYITYQHLWGLHIWLMLQESHYGELLDNIELQSNGNAQDSSSIANIPTMAHGTLTSIGLYQNHTLCLLMRSNTEQPTQPGYWEQPFSLQVRTFGPDKTLTQRLVNQVRNWSTVGRPFLWDSQWRMAGLRIYVYPPSTVATPGSNTILSERTGSNFVFSW